MKVGLYFGTYNPIHVGHLIIANHMAEFADLDQVWMVVTPHNPLKKKATLLDNHQRLEMVFLATEDYPKIKPSDIEFKLPQPNYTVSTLVHLQEKYPNNEFSLIMGEDNLNGLSKWKNAETLIKNHQIIVYPRTFEGEKKDHEYLQHENISLINAPIVEISATEIRKMIKEGKNVRPMLPPEVFDYLDGSSFYK